MKRASLELPSPDATPWLRFDASRIAFLMDFRRWLQAHVELARPSRLLVDAAHDFEISLMTPSYLLECAYDGTSRCDFHEMMLPEKNFTVMLLSQVVEHLYDPWLALHVIRLHLAPSGFVIISLPTFNMPHMEPTHFQHFTVRGISLLVRRVGFEVVEAGFFGCQAYMVSLFLNKVWPPYTICSPPEVNGDSPAQTWVLARRIELPEPLHESNRQKCHRFSSTISSRPFFSFADAEFAHTLINPGNLYAPDAVILQTVQSAAPVIATIDSAVVIVMLATVSFFIELAQNNQIVKRIYIDAEHHREYFTIARVALSMMSAAGRKKYVAEEVPIELWHTTRQAVAELQAQYCNISNAHPLRLAKQTSGWSASATTNRFVEVHIIGPALHFTIDVHALLLVTVNAARISAAARGCTAVFMLSCRVLDILTGPSDDFLWFCTPQGLAVYAQRAGLHVVHGNWWGTSEYAHELAANKRRQVFADALTSDKNAMANSWLAASTAWVIAE